MGFGLRARRGKDQVARTENLIAVSTEFSAPTSRRSAGANVAWPRDNEQFEQEQIDLTPDADERSEVGEVGEVGEAAEEAATNGSYPLHLSTETHDGPTASPKTHDAPTALTRGLHPDQVSIVLLDGRLEVLPKPRAEAICEEYIVADHDDALLRAAGVVLDEVPSKLGFAVSPALSALDEDRPWWSLAGTPPSRRPRQLPEPGERIDEPRDPAEVHLVEARVVNDRVSAPATKEDISAIIARLSREIRPQQDDAPSVTSILAALANEVPTSPSPTLATATVVDERDQPTIHTARNPSPTPVDQSKPPDQSKYPELTTVRAEEVISAARAAAEAAVANTANVSSQDQRAARAALDALAGPPSTAASGEGVYSRAAGSAPEVRYHAGDHPIVLQVCGLRRVFNRRGNTVTALDGIDLEIHAGELVALVGPTGAGKSTLLQCMAGLDSIDQGEVLLGGQAIHALGENERAAHRAAAMGFVFQTNNLLPVFTAIENVELPLLLMGWSAKAARAEALACLDHLGLAQRAKSRPSELSTGEQQRVAVARAVVGHPQIVWADEPTASLDADSARDVLAVLDFLHCEGMTIVLVTHDPIISAGATRVIEIRDGRIASDLCR